MGPSRKGGPPRVRPTFQLGHLVAEAGPRQLPLLVLDQAEDVLGVPDVQVHGLQPGLQDRVLARLHELVDFDGVAAISVHDGEQALHLHPVDVLGDLLLRHHDVVVRGRHLEGLVHEDAPDDADHGEADGALVDHREDAVPLA
eukprot:CAMPEP_0175625288 /NCGR_PEP_ID=MMETSP0096-20121207/70390_1 /TAXON_ID=311494 /ORGANISM="Alexandrium monilatum, Strain CCMP3105" /LENGTH=142 /DNA_ID=CAMNT_0016930617 /DNA_START=66 /DNA_END=490 /DNA_ORIENTATION=-